MLFGMTSVVTFVLVCTFLYKFLMQKKLQYFFRSLTTVCFKVIKSYDKFTRECNNAIIAMHLRNSKLN